MKTNYSCLKYVLLLCLLLLSSVLVAQPCAAATRILRENGQQLSEQIIKLNDIFQAKIVFFGQTEQTFMKVEPDDYVDIYSPRFALFITLETINPKESYKRIPDIDFRDRSFAFLVPGMHKPEVATFSNVKNSSYRALSGSVDVSVRQNRDGSYNVSARNKHVYDFAEAKVLYFRFDAPAHINIISFADNLVYAMKNKLSMEILIPYFDTFPQTDDKVKTFMIKLTPEILAEWQEVTDFDERIWKHIKPSAAGVQESLLKVDRSKQ